MILLFKKCGRCALKTLKGGMCPIFNRTMEDDEVCPYFVMELKYCELCGQPVPKGGILDMDDEGNYHLICDECGKASPCHSCVKGQECRFQTDRSCQEPPYIMVQQRQGNMVMQTQQLNKKRVEATCAQNCPCYYPEGLEDGNYCLKQICGGCANHKVVYRKENANA